MSGRQMVAGMMVVLALVAGACGSSRSDAGGTTSATIGDEGTPVDGGAVVWAVPAETQGWNPHDSKWAQSGALVGSSVLEPLATIDADLNAQPWLATAFVPNATYDSWTLTLRPDVTFQDGERFDADSVKLNIDDASTAGLSGAAVRGLFKQVTVVDDLTVKVDLTQPWAAFPSSFLNGQSALQMAPAMLAAPDRGQAHPDRHGSLHVLVVGARLHVQDGQEPAPTGRRACPTWTRSRSGSSPTATSRTAALQSGDVNLMLTTNARDANALSSDYTVVKNWTTEPGMAMTNTNPVVKGQPNPLANLHARKALAYATDRQALAVAAGDGVQSGDARRSRPTARGVCPEDQNGYVSFDLDQAKAEVARLRGRHRGGLAVHHPERQRRTPTSVRLLQLLQGQWGEAGIKVTIETEEAATFITDVVGGAYQVAMFSIYSSPDPDQNHYFWSAATAPGAGGVNINFTQYTTPQMEADLKTGRENPDHAARKAAYDDLVHQINAAAVNIWTVRHALLASWPSTR